MKTKKVATSVQLKREVRAYNARQVGQWKKICSVLMKEMDATLNGAENKIWHGSPVWFFDGNPVAAYTKLKDSVQVLFWSGQTFKEPGLTKEGSFKAAEKRYTNIAEIKLGELRRWLKKAKTIQWDYKNIVKRRGRLIRLK